MKPAIAIGALSLVTLALATWVVIDMNRIQDSTSYTPPDTGSSIAVTTVGSSGEQRTVRIEQAGKRDTAAAVKRVDDFEARWTDAIRLAESTSRIQLATPVKELQNLAREARTLELTECLEPGRDALTRSLDAQVSFFLAFMAQENWRQSDYPSTAARESRNWQMIKDACRYG